MRNKKAHLNYAKLAVFISDTPLCDVIEAANYLCDEQQFKSIQSGTATINNLIKSQKVYINELGTLSLPSNIEKELEKYKDVVSNKPTPNAINEYKDGKDEQNIYDPEFDDPMYSMDNVKRDLNKHR